MFIVDKLVYRLPAGSKTAAVLLPADPMGFYV